MNTEKTTISAFFAKDHDEIDAILAAVDFKNPAAALPKLREFDQRLERHIVWEEEVLFPAAARAEPRLGQGPIAVMLMEHVAIRAAKSKALDCLAKADGAGARGRIEEMLAVLSGHNMKEEHMLYPACDDLIPAEETERILALLAGFSR
jgi:iron-sulfur cluster repair protein YtfE (RIC family)